MKKILTFLAVLALVFSGLYVYQKSIEIVERQSTKQISVNLNSKILRIEEGKTALDLLNKFTKVETKGEGANAYVTSINGKKALTEKKEYWAFYVNGKPAAVGAGSYKLKSGDKIEWKIEKY